MNITSRAMMLTAKFTIAVLSVLTLFTLNVEGASVSHFPNNREHPKQVIGNNRVGKSEGGEIPNDKQKDQIEADFDENGGAELEDAEVRSNQGGQRNNGNRRGGGILEGILSYFFGRSIGVPLTRILRQSKGGGYDYYYNNSG